MGFQAVNKFRIKPGMQAEAQSLARQFYPIIMRLGCKSNRVFVVDVGGSSTGEMLSEFEFDSMGDWVAWREKFFADPETQALFPRFTDIFEAGEVTALSEWELG
jgi:hypothetical protein